MTCLECGIDPIPERLDRHLVEAHGWEVSRAAREYKAMVEALLVREERHG